MAVDTGVGRLGMRQLLRRTAYGRVRLPAVAWVLRVPEMKRFPQEVFDQMMQSIRAGYPWGASYWAILLVRRTRSYRTLRRRYG